MYIRVESLDRRVCRCARTPESNFLQSCLEQLPGGRASQLFAPDYVRKREKGGRRGDGPRRNEIIDSAVKITERNRSSRDASQGDAAIQSRGTPAKSRDNGARRGSPFVSPCSLPPRGPTSVPQSRGVPVYMLPVIRLTRAFVYTGSRGSRDLTYACLIMQQRGLLISSPGCPDVGWTRRRVG